MGIVSSVSTMQMPGCWPAGGQVPVSGSCCDIIIFPA